MLDPFRMDFHGCRKALLERLAETAPSRIQILTGPRQVGKTTLLLEIAQELGEEALYAAADAPEAGLPGFWERLWVRAAETATQRGRAVVLLDEVQHLGDWSRRMKGEWDRLRRRRLAVHVVATGSSALRLARGSRESLAGRFERLTLGHWSAAGLAEAFGQDPLDAAERVVKWGAYPGAVSLVNQPTRWRAYIRDAIVEPAIGRDLLALADIRRPGLLRQIYALATASPCQIVSLQKLQGQLQDPGALETIAHYLRLLEEAYLVAALEKFAATAPRRRAAPPKMLVLSNALLAASDSRGSPDPRRDPARFGAWLENACLAHAWNAGQSVRYWREEPLEVDAVIEGGWGSWAVEVKSGGFAAHELRGLLEFTRRFPAYRPLVVCDDGQLESARRAGVAGIGWKTFLLGMGPSPSLSTG